MSHPGKGSQCHTQEKTRLTEPHPGKGSQCHTQEKARHGSSKRQRFSSLQSRVDVVFVVGGGGDGDGDGVHGARGPHSSHRGARAQKTGAALGPLADQQQ